MNTTLAERRRALERRLNRFRIVLVGLILIAAGCSFAFHRARPPDVALQSQALFQAEQAMLFFALLLLPSILVWRLWFGEFPTRINLRKLEAEWGELADNINQAAGDVQEQLDALGEAIDAVKELVQAADLRISEARSKNALDNDWLYEQVLAVERQLSSLSSQVEELLDYVTREDW